MLFLAVVAAWVYSYGRVVFIRFYGAGEWGYGAAVSNGALYFIATESKRNLTSAPPAWIMQHTMMADVDLYDAQDFSFAGFGVHRERLNWLPVPPSFVRIPFWFIAPTFATLSLACWKWRGRRSTHRSRPVPHLRLRPPRQLHAVPGVRRTR
ncbi:MAG TPA: hypothetical protein VFB66_06505 [Tepidisphaeraceae bacterium]|nr:hypothetical protein [Tepidisphaeraceae bacterium]